MSLRRIPGQTSALPGAVVANGFVFTSGVVDPVALSAPSGSVPDIGAQVTAAVAQLLHFLAQCGAHPSSVVRVEAFLADPAEMGVWNTEFARIWPSPGPARTTLIVGFTKPEIRFEVQAIAFVTP